VACFQGTQPAPENTPGEAAYPADLAEDLSAGIPRAVIVRLTAPDASEERLAPYSFHAETSAEILAARAAHYADLSDQVRFDIAGTDAEEGPRLDHFPLMAFTLHEPEALAALAAHPDVAEIYADTPVEMTLSQSLGLIKQPSAAASGVNGTGTAVAVLDTGLDFTRPAFGSCSAAGAPGCAVVHAQDFAPSDGANDVGSFHGTNVAGIVLGVAPGAKIIALDVFRSDNLAYSSDILAALNWVIQNQATYNIVAVNMSLGGGGATAPCSSDVFASGVANVRAAGIVPVISSGNNGFTNAISSPACVPAAVSVGAVYDSNMGSVGWSACSDASTSADRVTCFSNSANFLSLLAPGAIISAAGINMGGTSQAAPHVAGAVAVVKAAFPSKTPDQVLSLLQDTGASVTDPRNGIVKKRIDLSTAVADCVLSVSPLSFSFDAAGGSGAVTVSASQGCAWDASSNHSFLTITSPSTASGTATITFSASSNSGAARQGTLSIARRTINISQASGLDTTGPTGSISINNGAAYTTTAAVTLQLSASDPSGVASMCVSNTTSCTTFTAFSATKSASLSSGAGTKTVNVWFRDALGNTSGPFSDSILFDNVKPTNGTLSAVGSSGQVALSWSGFNDVNSGIIGYRVVFAAGNSAPTSCLAGTSVYNSTGLSVTHPGLTNGTTYSYRACAVDSAGNVSTGSTAQARPASEYNPPTGSVTLNANAAFTGATTVTVATSASDASGVVSMCISNTTSCTSFSAFSASKSFTLASGAGLKTVRVWLRDGQNNTTTTPLSDTITLDNVKPTDGSVSASMGGGTVSLSWSGFSDSLSGIASYKVVVATGTTIPASCNTGTLLYSGAAANTVHSGTTSGTKYNYRVCALDAVGNLSAGRTLSVTP
jgi:hypothetical protein